MKKFFILLSIFIFFVQNCCFASVPVDFIYINGSNNNNEKMREWFLKGINKFHPVLKKQIENDDYTKKYLLNDGEYVIEDKPATYFWGFKSQQDFMYMRDKIDLLKYVSPIFAFYARKAIAEIMHDAIWVQKPHNMVGVVEDLNEQIQKEVKQGKKVVLLGYSAGTFITLEYLYLKAPMINIEKWIEEKDKSLSDDVKNYIKSHPKKNTCVTAFIGSHITMTTPLNEFILNPNKEELKKAYSQIDEYTDKYCIPENTVLGVINYASPIPLFYSDFGEQGTDIYNLSNMLIKYLIEHDFFFLTVNFADDPLGFPNGVNYTNEEIAEMCEFALNKKLGFFYDYSSTVSLRTFIGAHTAYWAEDKRFAKAIVKGYTEGHKYQYDKDFREKAQNSKRNAQNVYQKEKTKDEEQIEEIKKVEESEQAEKTEEK